MKVAGIESAAGPARAQGKAHGLVRQLQEGTFKGKSEEMHRARLADRLAAPELEPEEEPVVVDVLSEEPVEATESAQYGTLGTLVDYLA